MINVGKSGQACDKVAPGGGAVEGSWPDQPVAAHHDHLYIHPKHSTKICTYSFFAVNLHPCHHLSFFVWIKKVALAVKMVEITYSRKHECYYYDAMTFIWKNMTVIK